MLIQLRSRARDEDVENLVGRKPSPEDFGGTFSFGNVSVFKPDGQRLLTVVRKAISEEAAARAYPFLHALRNQGSTNRGNFAGEQRTLRVRKDGKESNTNVAPIVPSVVAGSLDRYPRIPFCRQTMHTSKDPKAWVETQSMLAECARAFEREVPDRYRLQCEVALKTHPAYVIPETPFTTVTINNTFAGGYHRDAGDFKPGFGVMAVLRRGFYRGCHIGFPAFGVSVDLYDRDVILFDPHEVHGNTPLTDGVGDAGLPEEGGHERISVVMYYREKMIECLSPAAEREHAKKLRGSFKEEA